MKNISEINREIINDPDIPNTNFGIGLDKNSDPELGQWNIREMAKQVIETGKPLSTEEALKFKN